jgi:hypothetical protein
MRRYLAFVAIWAALLLIAPVRYIWATVLVLAGNHRAWACLVAEDEAWNVPWGGSPSMTISARAEYARQRGDIWGRWLCRLLNWVQPGHCANAIKWGKTCDT